MPGAILTVQLSLSASNTNESNARSTATALVSVEADGQKGHGLSRIPNYTAQTRSGEVDRLATSSVERPPTASPANELFGGFSFPRCPGFKQHTLAHINGRRTAPIVSVAVKTGHKLGIDFPPLLILYFLRHREINLSLLNPLFLGNPKAPQASSQTRFGIRSNGAALVFRPAR